jgi:hypothetical protein
MSRLTGTTTKEAYASGTGQGPTLNLGLGGQHGWAPNLTEWINNQAYVSRPAYCLVVEAPQMFQHMPNSAAWVTAFKSLFELHAYSFEGLNAELKVETDTHDIGGAGEKQHEVVNVTRETSTPKFSFIEKYGRPIQTLHEYWIRYGLMDPDTKFALLGTRGEAAVTDMLASWYSATLLFIVPDPLHKTVDRAWLTSNVFPMSAGANTAKRDLKTGQEILTLDIEYAGFSQYGLGVNAFAQTLLDATNVNLKNADPFMRGAFQKALDSNVTAAAKGYSSEAKRVADEAAAKLGA